MTACLAGKMHTSDAACSPLGRLLLAASEFMGHVYSVALRDCEVECIWGTADAIVAVLDTAEAWLSVLGGSVTCVT